MRLQELQRAFQARVLAFAPGIELVLDNRQDTDLEPRLDAYVGGYRTRLVEALAASYPVLQKTLGNQEFERQMREYVDATCSRHYSVREYGADIAQWLAASDNRGNGAKLAELARWEWTLGKVFDAPDDDPLELSALANVSPEDWPRLSFTLRSCVRQFQTSSNVVQWWRATNGLCEQPRDLTDAAPSQWLMWRRGVKTLFRSLDTIEATILDTARAGTAFGHLCEQAALYLDESAVAFRTAAFLRGWITEELIAGYSLRTDTE